MTANKTPNLGLMSPSGPDAFDVNDYTATFAILDENPGILPIPNQASRPTGWSAAQNGRMVLQADQNIIWTWLQPSGATQGAWSRLGGKGRIGGGSFPGNVNTSATSWQTGPTIANLDLLVPGGRLIQILYTYRYVANDHTRHVFISTLLNGTVIKTNNHVGVGFQTAGVPGGYEPLRAGTHSIINDFAPTTQKNLNVQLRLYSPDPAVYGSVIGGGVSSSWDMSLDVIEI